MVRIRDEGSEFDAPLDVVWRFLQSPETHLAAHRGERNHRVEPSGPNTVLAHWEIQAGDRWVPVTNRVTFLPPVATMIESLEGPMKGTKLVHVYTASGAKTRVDVYGEFVLVGVPDGETEGAAAGGLSAVFEADNEALRAFAELR